MKANLDDIHIRNELLPGDLGYAPTCMANCTILSMAMDLSSKRM